MGLDWNPGPKAKLGYEQEFVELWKKLHAKSCFFREKKVQRFGEITQTAFETLAVPRIGFDDVATEWARQNAFPRCVDKSLTEDVFVERMRGFYVLDLVPPCDGIPRYTNGAAGGYVERFSFRAQHLVDCKAITGEKLFEDAYVSKLPEGTVLYGAKLLRAAETFAVSQKIDTTNIHLAEDPDSIEFQLDAVYAAARWCRYWGACGHWLEAYF